MEKVKAQTQSTDPSQGPVGRGQDRVFTINPQEVQASDATVVGTLYINKVKVRILFDSEARYFFSFYPTLLINQLGTGSL